MGLDIGVGGEARAAPRTLACLAGVGVEGRKQLRPPAQEAGHLRDAQEAPEPVVRRKVWGPLRQTEPPGGVWLYPRLTAPLIN